MEKDEPELEERKIKEIEHSRVRRQILQGFERHSDTHSSEESQDLESMIRDKDAFKKHFSNIKFYSVTHLSEKYLYDFLEEHCGNNTKVLDFACGNGENGIFAAQSGADVMGMDISPEGIDNANANAREMGVDTHCKFEVMDGENMTFSDNTFDVGVEYGALHHVDLDKAMSELARVLKPGAKMICVEALRHNPLIHWYRKRTPHLRTEWEVDHILRVQDLATVEKHFRKVEVKFFHLAVLASVPFRKTPFFKLLRGFLDKIDNILLKKRSVGKYAWIMVFIASDPIK